MKLPAASGWGIKNVIKLAIQGVTKVRTNSYIAIY